MYTPKYFEVRDRGEIFSFIESNAFGQLISMVDEMPFATHLPFQVSSDQTALLAHLARPNPQLASIDGQKVLVTLQGPHDYVSPSWYNGAGVPTWNYQAVHITGSCSVFNDAERLADLVNTLTEKYEAKLPQPWQPNYGAAMLRAISGVEISIERIQCQYKLSQNKSTPDRENVIRSLSSNGSDALAEAMQRELDQPSAKS